MAVLLLLVGCWPLLVGVVAVDAAVAAAVAATLAAAVSAAAIVVAVVAALLLFAGVNAADSMFVLMEV